jgi:hypothetical protein
MSLETVRKHIPQEFERAHLTPRSFHSGSIKGKVKLGGYVKNKKHPKRPRKMRCEYGPSYFAEQMSGLAAAAR